jgi:predicted secreted Zn-dependent protease
MKHLLRWAVLLPCLAAAQVHECKDANGHRVFSDVPCGPDAKLLDVRPAVGQPFVHPQETMQVEYYDVTGATFDELRGQMHAKGVDGWAGTTWTHVKYDFTVHKDGSGCRIDSANAIFDARVRLPRWVNRRAAPEASQQAWDAWFPTLQRHEDGHVRIGHEAAARVERAVWDTPPAATCVEVIARAKARAGAVLVDLRQQQEDYDLRTDHGRKQ